MKLSEIYGKEVESKDGQVHGWVRGILAKNGAPQFLQCFDDDEHEFDIDVKNIICTGEKIVFEDRPAIKKQSTNMRLGVPAYSEYGNFLGYLAEIITDRSGAAAHYVIGKKKFRPEHITTGDVIIVHPARVLKEEVTDSSGEVILKKGSALTGEALKKAEQAGEYFQAQMKTI